MRAALWGMMALLLLPGTVGAQAAAADSALSTKTSDSSIPELSLEALADKLEATQGERIDFELRSGKLMVRCKLVSLTRDGAKGPKTLRVEDGDSGKVLTLSFSAIRGITLEREKLYEAGASSPAEKKALAAAQAAAAELETWNALAVKNGAEPWPVLSNAEHEAAIEKNRKLFEAAKEMFPGLELYETHEFMFCSNMPREQVMPYAASLDKMYDMMCAMYDIKKGTPVWKGKCLVMAFVEDREFQLFQSRLLDSPVSRFAQGLCQQFPDGTVIMSCYRGDDPLFFGKLLVHETSHGFIFRYRTSEHIPSWVNEGMADWIGHAIVPGEPSVPQRQRRAVSDMMLTHSLQGLFDAQPIDGDQYGAASSITDFLIRTDKKKYARFITLIKQGNTWQESLQEAYKATPEQLLAAYGQTIGVPDLRP